VKKRLAKTIELEALTSESHFKTAKNSWRETKASCKAIFVRC